MNTAPTIRLHLYFAHDNARAVILRQGPKRLFRMILWDRDNDTFEDGQWLRHQVYPDRCDLSPDGQYFIYFALDAKWDSQSKGSYTAISRPPWFTALSLYPQGDTWGGGGLFVGNELYVVHSGSLAKDIIHRADNLERVYQIAPTREIATGIVRADGSRAPLSRDLRLRILSGETWRSPIDHYDTLGGNLYRRTGEELDLIRDFSDMSFTPLRAPYDWRGKDDEDMPDPSPWHPLDEEDR